MSEFLSFCFQHFEVGIWTSLQAKNAYPLIGRILGAHVEICHSNLILDSGLVNGSELFPKIYHWKELDRMTQEACKIQEEEARSLALVQIAILRNRMLSTSLVRGKLSLLWTQRRCIVAKDGRAFNMKDDRPFMLKDLSSIWSDVCQTHHSPLPLNEHMEKILIDHRDNSYLFSIESIRCFKEINVHIPPRLDLPSDEWGPSNTILIDDSAYKFSQNPLNGIAISPFDENSSNDTILFRLMQYLDREILSAMKSNDNFDIREILKAKPFSEFTTCEQKMNLASLNCI